jgi:hypothetical protein
MLKRAAVGAAVVAFGGGWALVGHNAVGVTATSASNPGNSGVTAGALPSGTVPGLGRPDSQGFFTFQSGFAQQEGASASRVSRTRPSFRSRSS